MEAVDYFIVAALLFVAIDSVWLKFVANTYYKKQIGKLLAPKPDFLAAGVFYALYMIGVVVFVIDPALDKASFGFALWHGALLGLLMYATYDLTNQATLKDWPWKLTVVDLAWGTVVTAAVSSLTFVIFR